MRAITKRLTSDRKGATAIEYGLLAGLVAVAIVTVVTTLGTNLSTVFNNVNTKLATVATA